MASAVRTIYFFAFISVILQQSVLSVPIPVHKLEDSDISHLEISRMERSAETENLHLENSAAQNQDEIQLVLVNKATGARPGPGSHSDMGMRQGRQFGNAFASANANANAGGYGGYGGGYPGYGFPSYGGSSSSAIASASSLSNGFYGK